MSSSLDPSVPAAAALPGVALTLPNNWVTERRRWRRERESAAEERQLEVRQSTRLVELELWEAEQLITAAVVAGSYRDGLRASTRAWETWRAYVARHLGVADWRGVAMAFEAIHDLNRLLDTREANAEGALLVEDEDQLQARWDAVRNASWILRGEAGEGEKVHSWLAENEKLEARLFGAPNDPDT